MLLTFAPQLILQRDPSAYVCLASNSGATAYIPGPPLWGQILTRPTTRKMRRRSGVAQRQVVMHRNRAASTTLANSIRMPSPVVLTMRP